MTENVNVIATGPQYHYVKAVDDATHLALWRLLSVTRQTPVGRYILWWSIRHLINIVEGHFIVSETNDEINVKERRNNLRQHPILAPTSVKID